LFEHDLFRKPESAFRDHTPGPAAGHESPSPVTLSVRWSVPLLDFPNQSRFFDPTRRAVRFWGYDNAMEWSFFVSEEALRSLQPNMDRDTVSLLRAFDANLTTIHAAATKAYNRERKGFYDLLVTDF
jgi:Protein of unknown function (DUF1488)